MICSMDADASSVAAAAWPALLAVPWIRTDTIHNGEYLPKRDHHWEFSDGFSGYWYAFCIPLAVKTSPESTLTVRQRSYSENSKHVSTFRQKPVCFCKYRRIFSDLTHSWSRCVTISSIRRICSSIPLITSSFPLSSAMIVIMVSGFRIPSLRMASFSISSCAEESSSTCCFSSSFSPASSSNTTASSWFFSYL